MGVVSGTHAFTVSEWNRLIARPVSNGLYFPNGESEPYTADNVNINAPEMYGQHSGGRIYLKG